MTRLFLTLLCLTALGLSRLPAAVFYVDINSPNPTPPYSDWTTASTDIQSAIDAAADGDQIWVNDGVYQTGGRVVYGATTNRVVINKALTVQSVHGPGATSILGFANNGNALPTNGFNAVRCVYLTNNASLIGFTLAYGAGIATTGPSQGEFGGAWCESTNSSILFNCIFVTNNDGAVYQGTVTNCTLASSGADQSILNNCVLTNFSVFLCLANNCLFTGNSSTRFIDTSTLNNCTVAGNPGEAFGPDNAAILNNCIVYYDNIPNGDFGAGNYHFTNCCVFPIIAAGNSPQAPPAGVFVNCFTNPPVFVDQANGNYHLAATSPCINHGTNIYASSATDLDGNPRIVGASVDIGAYEYQTVITNSIHYVNCSNSTPSAPYTSWLTAAKDIQSAVDASFGGDQIIVTDGVYQVGGRLNTYLLGGTIIIGRTTNRVAINRAIAVQSVNGPGVTSIIGYQVPGTTNGSSAIRCVFLATNASLNGFTLAFGATQGGGGSSDGGGGGVMCEDSNSYVQNCIIVTNAAGFGGGTYQGTLANCIVADNFASAFAGAAYFAVLNDCSITNNITGSLGNVLNPPVSHTVLNNCFLMGNSPGGPATSSTLNNCSIIGNYGQILGSGNEIYDCLIVGNYGPTSSTFPSPNNVYNCTIAENTGQTFDSFGRYNLCNCIVYYNDNGTNGVFSGLVNLTNCIAPTLPASAINCFTNPPSFVDLANGNYRLNSNSPCINAGANLYAPASPDLDGNPRIVGGTVDVGAYEYQSPASIISYAWLQQFGLPIDGSADLADSDGDGLNNWQEWKSGTIPTNAASVLQLMSPAVTNTVSSVIVTWQSATNITYFVQRSSNLAAQPPFTTIQSNLPSQGVLTSYTDTSTTNNIPYFYRVGVQ